MRPSPEDCIHGLVGQSAQITATRRLIGKAARNRLPVLLLGESGTGKEVVARAIHAESPQGQFVPIDCGALVGTLVESELFGHVKGSFSGAVENKKGLVEVADGGTAFFDEIGDLPMEMQVKLLRLLQEREFRPVGALRWHKVDLRIIAATHRDLKAEVAAGRFRQDLYYRLNVMVIHVPALRERKVDIPLLVGYFIDQAREARLPEFCAGDDVMRALLAYDWPGNVRELKNCIDRMAAVQSEGVLRLADLPSPLQYHGASVASLQDLGDVLNEHEFTEFVLARKAPVITIPDSERRAIEHALAATGGEKGKAARLLQIGRTTLYRKMKEYGLD